MTMDIIDKRIYSCNEAICKNIESLQANERGLLSQNILSQLRNFLECVFLKIYVASGNSNQNTTERTEGYTMFCSYRVRGYENGA